MSAPTINPSPKDPTQPGTPGGLGTQHRERRRSSVNIPLTALVAVLSLTILVPLYFTVVTALKSPDQLGGTGFELPTSIHVENFSKAWELTNFPHALLISGIVTVGAVVLTLITNSLVAYAIARNMHRPFFKALYYFFIAALFVPFPIIMLPVTKEMAVLHLDNPVGLFLLYTVYGLSFNVFVYTAFIKSIPPELEEAAIMDGASVWTTFRKVIFPILTPMNATVGILTCMWAWNDFLLPLVILSDPNTRTLPLVQYVFQGQFNTDYTTAFASYLMALAPLLLVYLFAQRWVISGVMRGSIK
ncbi:raffinose/stachyose/melibiose transport system permease protein [Arthrobacter stackebrandtii]|uniref:Raffinose/stachyose/melibiose transport system permease protein n=1 Tax=Arthrobacter stackebrandtii TaxID=272161 RepID=A0ABS4YX24_9MICC|nr:carbohydrate ABC transporter permease [Arthrobacter stackebrandtii]MBP2413366.1 raffinose/stachyose/melibiose transport system permease protein [Arthrobacter stackebrandtii]PYG99542.1 ABC transporter permease [Arthrobacter stackebrandtii]